MSPCGEHFYTLCRAHRALRICYFILLTLRGATAFGPFYKRGKWGSQTSSLPQTQRGSGGHRTQPRCDGTSCCGSLCGTGSDSCDRQGTGFVLKVLPHVDVSLVPATPQSLAAEKRDPGAGALVRRGDSCGCHPAGAGHGPVNAWATLAFYKRFLLLYLTSTSVLGPGKLVCSCYCKGFPDPGFGKSLWVCFPMCPGMRAGHVLVPGSLGPATVSCELPQGSLVLAGSAGVNCALPGSHHGRRVPRQRRSPPRPCTEQAWPRPSVGTQQR